MPKYAKFVKDVISSKKKLGEFEKVNLNEECSDILQQKLPAKSKDSGSFTIACEIGGMEFGKELCDLGASINLIPFSIFKKLKVGKTKTTTIALQLADRSVTYPQGIVEDVLIKVSDFIFPADFVVLDMEEDRNIPLILGRPFLATGRALIDVARRELKLRVNDESRTFSIYKPLKYFDEEEVKYMDECKALHVLDSGIFPNPLKSSKTFLEACFSYHLLHSHYYFYLCSNYFDSSALESVQQSLESRNGEREVTLKQEFKPLQIT